VSGLLDTGTGRWSVGVCARALGPGTPAQTVCRAGHLGLRLVEFGSVFDVTPTLDLGDARELRSTAAEHGVEVTVSAGVLSVGRTAIPTGFLRAGAGNLAAGLGRVLEVARVLGASDVQIVVGTMDDRGDGGRLWQDQLASTAELLCSLRGVVHNCGVRFAIKTHEEINSREILALIDEVGSDVVGVALDPVNSPVRLEEPVAAAARLARYVTRVHYDDAWIIRTTAGLARRRALGGSGDLPWRVILDVIADAQGPGPVPVLIDLHRAEFDMPVHDAEWLSSIGDVSVRELGSLLARAGGAREPERDEQRRFDAALSALGGVSQRSSVGENR
jgi:sugar phosphate isomerase/epimerase